MVPLSLYLDALQLRKQTDPASLVIVLKTVDNILANRCSRRLGRPIYGIQISNSHRLLHRECVEISKPH